MPKITKKAKTTTAHLAPVIIAELLVANKIKNVVASPGTRNAPLIVAAKRCGELTLHSVVDERTAAFVALGMAIRTEKPVALICTSGTAMLNYAPAVAEAYYRGVPLIVITADRPARWVDQDDSQTIRQPGALNNIVLGSYVIPSDENIRDFRWLVNRTVNEAILKATGRPKGPVHINIHLDAPLGAEVPYPDLSTLVKPIKVVTPLLELNKPQIKPLAKRHINSKIMVIVGTSRPDAALNNALAIFNNNPNVIVFHEAQSNIRGLRFSVSAIDATLRTVTDEEKSVYYPNLIISIGGSIVSQPLKQWLRSLPPEVEHWYIKTEAQTELVDCFQHLTAILDVNASKFIKSLSGIIKHYQTRHTGYQQFWEKKVEIVNQCLKGEDWCSQWSDLWAVRRLFELIPTNANVHLSNGMAIRYAQCAAYQRVHRVECNRGCSGIDGSTSTAIGAAIDCDRPTILITGDTSARYDLGGLAIGRMAKRLTIFVINNNGGEIFRIIQPTRSLPECESYLAAPQQVSFKGLAEAFGYQYAEIRHEAELNLACRSIRSTGGCPHLFEIITTNADNAAIYRNLFHELNKASQNESRTNLDSDPSI